MSSRTSEPAGGRRLWAIILALGGAAGSLSSCLSIEAPSFLVLESGTDSLKAMTPEDARIWVREFDDPSQGDLGFWTQALRNDLVSNRGYTLLEERKVKDADGEEGVEMHFEVTAGGRAQRYIAALYVFEGLFSNTIRVAEYVAPRELHGKYEAEVRKAFAAISP
jgi:hypothetical protein